MQQNQAFFSNNQAKEVWNGICFLREADILSYPI